MYTAAMSSQQVMSAVEHIGSVLTAAGLPRLPSRVFACLLLDEDGRMTAAELAAALTVSPAAISGAVRYLASVHMIRREREPGTRRDVFVVLDDAWHDMMLSTAQVHSVIRQALLGGQAAVGGLSTRAGRRVALSASFLDFLIAETDSLRERWETRKVELERELMGAAELPHEASATG